MEETPSEQIARGFAELNKFMESVVGANNGMWLLLLTQWEDLLWMLDKKIMTKSEAVSRFQRVRSALIRIPHAELAVGLADQLIRTLQGLPDRSLSADERESVDAQLQDFLRNWVPKGLSQ